MVRALLRTAGRFGSALTFAAALGVGCGSSSTKNDAASDASTPDGNTDRHAGLDQLSMDMAIPDGVHLDGMVSCTDDARVDDYQAGMTKAGQAGAAKVTIVSANPSPPVRGENTWTVRVLNSADQPLASSIVIDTFMPDHGHGGLAPTVAAGASAGSFTISALNLFMAGVWRVQISVYPAGGADAGALVDTVTFFFCVQG